MITMGWLGGDDDPERELHDTTEKIKEEVKLEKQELQEDEEALEALDDAMHRFEDLRPVLEEIREVSDGGTIDVMDVGAILQNHGDDYPSQIKGEVEQLRDDLGTAIEDLREKSKQMKQDEKAEQAAEQHIQDIAQNQLADLQNVVNAIDQASQQDVEVASNFD